MQKHYFSMETVCFPMIQSELWKMGHASHYWKDFNLMERKSAPWYVSSFLGLKDYLHLGW